MKSRNLYLLLFVAGVVIPYSQFAPWVLEHGFDLRLMVEQLFANKISAFFGIDVLVSSIVVFAMVRRERRRLGPRWWMPVAAVLLCGVSAGLPLFLYLRETPDGAAN